MRLRESPTAALSPPFLRALRAMLDAAFARDFADADWAHALGGRHVWLEGTDGAIVSHGCVVERRLGVGTRALRVGYVEALATAGAHRHRGHCTTVMRRLGQLIADRYELGVLSTGAHAFYARLGWVRWRGATWVDAAGGRVRTPDDDDSIMILETPASPSIALTDDIVADWRDGDVW
jgi:aminoglycoside 2'-N-acetyltransferase I